MKSADASIQTRIIQPRSGWRLIDVRELWDYRDLFYFLTWRDIKVKYAQSVLGVGWAIVQPVFFMIVFTIVFGKLAKVSSDGVPYPVFSFAALVPWVFFSTAVVDGSDSLVRNANMLTKVYFPRLVMPMASVMAKLVDFGIALILLFAIMAWYRIAPSVWALALPLLILLMVLTSAGLGMWLTALAIQYRDIKHAMSFVMQLAMYASPVVYPASLIPHKYFFYGHVELRELYALNPMVGVIEGFRSALLSTTPMPWDLIKVGAITAVLMAIGGAFYFRRMERIFADVA